MRILISLFLTKNGQINQIMDEYVSNDYNLYTRIKNWLALYVFLSGKILYCVSDFANEVEVGFF